MKMIWNVFYFNFNKREITTYNIFSHGGFMNDLIKFHKETKVYNKEQLSEKLERLMRYYFWCKCEWEVIVSEWPPAPPERNVEVKIDVFDQVEANWDKFVDYVWTNIPFLMAEMASKYSCEEDDCGSFELESECEYDEYDEYDEDDEDEYCVGYDYDEDDEDEYSVDYDYDEYDEYCIETDDRISEILIKDNEIHIFYKR